MVQFFRLVGIGVVLSGALLSVALRWGRPADPEPYLIYIAYLDDEDTVTLRLLQADGAAPPIDLITPRRDWIWFNRFTITHDGRYLLFNVRDPSGTHARQIDLSGRPVQNWGGHGQEENFYSLMPDPDQALVAIADTAFQTFFLYQTRIGTDAAQPLGPLKVSLRGKPPLWWGDWIVFQHITERGLGVAALHTVSGAMHDLSAHVPVAYLEALDGGWAYLVGYGSGQDGTIFRVRVDGADLQTLGQTATSFSTPLRVVDGTLLYQPPADGVHPPTVWTLAGAVPAPLLETDDAVWYSSSADGWVIVQTAPADGVTLRDGGPFEVVRVRPDGSGAARLPAPSCYDIVGQAWSDDGRVHFTGCYRDHRYWLAARSLPDGDFIGQRFVDLPVQPEITAAPSGAWALLRVVNDRGGVDYYRAGADGATLIQLTDDSSQKDFATWYDLPSHRPTWLPWLLGGIGGGVLVRLRRR